MPETQNATAGITEADQEAIGALLDDLDLGDDEIIETSAVEDDLLGELSIEDTEINESEEAAALRAIDREAHYEEQESEIAVDTLAEKADKTAKKAKAPKTPRAPKAPAVPRTPRDLASIDPSAFVLEGAPEDLDANKATVMAAVPSQKKIAEKFENIFAAISVGKQPSVYVVQAFKLLDDRKELTASDLTSSFKLRYKQGTAMSQSGQIMKLFEVLKIATRDKNKLTLNANSVIASKLRDILTPAPAAA
ncbi:hypothetical protein [Phyllobacterium myrsinacearum]|uniref:Uncharacterized protein n=1 Tax=Phyllobacterium myrsinacearum TaxID=28101 RepID=A0A839EZ27_9HYPH|nr:hypothetical protein [Phyllobacterium myrsinacearum]MBA8881637.1 hypothetical protein [Phyllobacterium myrsinacearum]